METPPGNALSGQPAVLVAILKGKRDISVTGARLSYSVGGNLNSVRGGSLLVEAGGGGLRLNGIPLSSDSIAVSGAELKVNGRPYRGTLRLIMEGGLITVINRIGMEDYLMGIINHEVSSAWPIEAVKAQAVAARTYAYDKLKKRHNSPYHLESTVMDQVYGGSSSEDVRAIRAVNETRGEVLFYGEEVVQALFHSSCGGHTESAVDVWGGDYPYLRGIEDRYCTEAPNYFWIYEISFDNISQLLKDSGYGVGGSPDIRISGRTESGRVKEIKFDKTAISGRKLREIAGYGNIKSTLFDLKFDGRNVTFSGSGSGHGVGLCQWGAKGMAEEGAAYRDILGFYYGGTKIRKVY